MTHDLRYAARVLLRNPGFAAVAIVTLAIAIGANTAIFSVVNGVLLEPLPYPDPERLVRIWGTWDPDDPAIEPNLSGNVNPLDALDWRKQNRAFEKLAILHFTSATLRDSAAEPLRISTTRVSADFFGTLGVRPYRGRFFEPSHEQLGNEQVLVLSHGLWQRRFGSDPAIIGKTVELNGNPFTILGILPRGFRSPIESYLGDPELWRPLAINRATVGRGGHFMYVIASLRRGVTVAQGQSDIDSISRRLGELYPDSNRGFGGRVEPLRDATVGSARRPLLILLAAVGLVLLIASVNLANLFLARATARRRELTVRLALGASRRRVARQLLTETFLLAAVGGILGLLLGTALTRLLIVLASSQIPRLDAVRLDTEVLLFTGAIAILATIVSGFLPALFASRTKLAASLKESGRSATLGRGGRRLSKALVVAEIGLSMVLLISAGLMMKSFWRLRNAEPGIDPRRLVEIGVPFGDTTKALAFYSQVIERLSSTPGVQSATAANFVPFTGEYSCDGYSIEGDRSVAGAQLPCAEARIVIPGYFETMGIRVVAGRPFLRTDDANAPRVAVVSESMARKFPSGKALGKRIKWGRVDNKEPWRTVVGIVRDIRHFGLESEPAAEIYTPALQNTTSYMTLESLVVRTQKDPRAALPFIREAIWQIDPSLPLNKVSLMEELVAESVAKSRFRTVIVGAFAALALILAATGIYGVMSYSVTSRTQEFGVLIALGAQQGQVLGNVLRTAAGLTGLGVILGLGAALLLTRTLAGLLHQVSTTDLATFVTVPAALAVVALLSSFIPALRAMRVDPAVALRYE